MLRGHEFIDVPGHMSRDYKLNFYAYKEGVTNAKITFKNESTQEYMFYTLAFKALPPGAAGTIEMSTSVRKLVSREVTITNPLNIPVSFNAVCSHPEISTPQNFLIPPK